MTNLFYFFKLVAGLTESYSVFGLYQPKKVKRKTEKK